MNGSNNDPKAKYEKRHEREDFKSHLISPRKEEEEIDKSS